MRVLIAPDRLSDAEQGSAAVVAGAGLDSACVAEAAAAGWRAARPGDELTTRPMGDGAHGLTTAMLACGGSSQPLVVPGPFGEPTPVAWVRAGGTGYLDAGPLLGDPGSGDARTLAVRGSSGGVGHALRAMASAGVRRCVVGLGPAGVHDAGAGALRALAGPRDGDVGHEVLSEAAQVLTSVEVVLAVSDWLPLTGLDGAGAALAGRPGIDGALAQQVEQALTPLLRVVDAAPEPSRGLVVAGQTSVRRSRRPGLGAGGGLGLLLAALGAHVRPGAEVIAHESGVPALIGASDLVLTVGDRLDGEAIDRGVPATLGRFAMPALVPVVAVAQHLLTSRRELAGTGVEGSYLLREPGHPTGSGAGSAALVAAVSHRASRVARTWSR